MSAGLEFDWKSDERKQDAPTVSIEVWDMLDTNKAANGGWFVLHSPTVKDLRKMLNEGVVMALEADECRVRFTYSADSRVVNFPCGLDQVKVRRMIFEAERKDVGKSFNQPEF